MDGRLNVKLKTIKLLEDNKRESRLTWVCQWYQRHDPWKKELIIGTLLKIKKKKFWNSWKITVQNGIDESPGQSCWWWTMMLLLKLLSPSAYAPNITFATADAISARLKPSLCLLLLFSHSVISDLCNPTDCSTLGFPVLHHLPKFVQIHVHGVDGAI